MKVVLYNGYRGIATVAASVREAMAVEEEDLLHLCCFQMVEYRGEMDVDIRRLALSFRV